MKYYQISWFGCVYDTLNAAGHKAGCVPFGGKHVKTEEQAKDLIDRFISRCGQWGGTVRAAHSPRITCSEKY